MVGVIFPGKRPAPGDWKDLKPSEAPKPPEYPERMLHPEDPNGAAISRPTLLCVFWRNQGTSHG
jgi:hypothetical protein